MNIALSYLNDRTPAQIQAGEQLSVTLTGLGAVTGNVSLRWWRTGEPEATHAERVAWVDTSAGVTLTVQGAVTRYLDGKYNWALWFEPTTGEHQCLMPASTLFVSTSGGFVSPAPDYVTQAELAAAIDALREELT